MKYKNIQNLLISHNFRKAIYYTKPLLWGAVFSPIGALIAAVVAVIMASCFALWKYWDRFSSFVKGFARGIARAFGRAFEAIMRFLGADTATITH